jgi:sigma-E factor negative regulatory protein RseB
LAPSYSTENFRWLTQPSRHVSHALETDWASTDMPQGFEAVATHGETLPGSDAVVTHIIYSDGLSSVSVFIAPQDSAVSDGHSRVGGSNSFSAVIDGHRVTAVGEVPVMTVEQIATTMMRH